ncbi:MAG: SH3 domain-containing protein [Firmicutes bacterium]|nr:SH3 domain-containing protein [Bacillota bacterium]
MSPARRKKRKKTARSYWLALCIILLAGFTGAFYLYFIYPGLWYVEPPQQVRVVLGAELLDVPAVVGEEEILLPVNAVKEHLDPNLFWDEEEERLTITTKDRVIRMRSEQLTAYLNKQAVQLEVPVRIIDKTPYMPLVFLQDLYGIKIHYFENTLTVVIDRASVPCIAARTAKNVIIRQGPSLQEPRVALLQSGERVNVYREEKGWYHVRTGDGLLGYVPKKNIHIEGITTAEAPPRQESVDKPPWRPMGSKIGLVWEHVISRTPSVESIGPMPGINVVSPTWFSLRNEEGDLSNLADLHYVNWAHAQGYQVWALVSNGFDRDLTASVLRSSEKREKVIGQLLAFSQLYDLDGINIDFENMHLQDRDNFTQFIRELTPLAREQGLTLSVDVTFKSSSINWSQIYDRKALAESVDYVMVMAYDEHWGTSPVAGSVSSLPWVERGLQGILQEVPADKLLLGIPFYTRLWEIEYLEGGSEKVSSRAYGMDRIKSILEEAGAQITFCEESGQNVATYQQGYKHYKVWLEDLTSLESRLALIEKYGLAGAAAWRRGFESNEVWDIFDACLNNRRPKNK